MRARAAFRWMALSCLLPSLSGCALLFVKGPPDNHQELESFECTESRIAPVLDLIMAGGYFLAAGQEPGYYAAPDYYGQGGPVYGSGQDNTPNILGALLYGVSGAVGLGRVNSCREAKEELRARLAASAQAVQAARAAQTAPSVPTPPAARRP